MSDRKGARNVELALINTDGTQTRVQTSAEHIEDLAAVLLANGELPPVDLRRDPEHSRYWIVDGYHRVMAHILAKRKIVNAIVSDGNQSDALWDACGSNMGHGLRRTNLDKRKAIRIALEHRYGQEDPSDNAIAKHCRVSNHLVAAVRAELLAEKTQLGEFQVEASAPKRKGRDGKVRALPKPARVPAEARVEPVLPPEPPPPPLPASVPIGLAVPPGLSPAWAAMTTHSGKVLSALRDARFGIAALKSIASRAATDASYMDRIQRDALHRFGQDLDAMIVRAEGYRPHAVCEACKGEGCSRCKGRGWLSKQEHEAMVRGQEARR